MEKYKFNLAKETDEDGFMPSACAYISIRAKEMLNGQAG